MEDDKAPKTAGISPALSGSLSVLQFTHRASAETPWNDEIVKKVEEAAVDLCTYQRPTDDSIPRFEEVKRDCVRLLINIVRNCPPGPARSTAISRLFEVRMWANNAIALEGH